MAHLAGHQSIDRDCHAGMYDASCILTRFPQEAFVSGILLEVTNLPKIPRGQHPFKNTMKEAGFTMICPRFPPKCLPAGGDAARLARGGLQHLPNGHGDGPPGRWC